MSRAGRTATQSRVRPVGVPAAVRRAAVSAVAVLTVAGSFVYAAAASLGGVQTQGLAAGSAVVAACDSDGLTVAFTTSGGSVTTVTVGGIADPGCEGGRLAVTVTNSSSAAIGSSSPQTIPADGDVVDNSVAVAVSPQPSAEQVTGVHISIVGP